MVTHPHTNRGQCCLTSMMKPAHKAVLPPKQQSYENWKEGKSPTHSNSEDKVMVFYAIKRSFTE